MLGRILNDLGSTLIEVLAGEADPARTVTGVLIQDPLDEPARLPGAVVLGVGVYGAGPVAALVDRAAGLGAAAVVVRSPVPVYGSVSEAAARTGVTVLGLTPGASWAQVAALLRSLLAVDELGTVGGPDEADGAEPLAGDLFALANATAGLLDGPVTVEDRGGRVLAFSSRQDEADEDRIATVLDRQVPAEKLRALEERGAFQALYRKEEPVYVDGISDKPRVAIAVRAAWRDPRLDLGRGRRTAERGPHPGAPGGGEGGRPAPAAPPHRRGRRTCGCARTCSPPSWRAARTPRRPPSGSACPRSPPAYWRSR